MNIRRGNSALQIAGLVAVVALLAVIRPASAQQGLFDDFTLNSKVSAVVPVTYNAPDAPPQMGGPWSTPPTERRAWRSQPNPRMRFAQRQPQSRISAPAGPTPDAMMSEGEELPTPQGHETRMMPSGQMMPGTRIVPGAQYQNQGQFQNEFQGAPEGAFEEQYAGGEWNGEAGGCGGGGCGGGCCGGGCCGGCCGGGCGVGYGPDGYRPGSIWEECLKPDPWFYENFSLVGGVQGFKGPPDFGINGNYGFAEGLNWGLPLWDTVGLGVQAGVLAVQSNLSGGGLSEDARNQVFGTLGLFHRPMCGRGFQGAVAFDYLRDDLVDVNLTQVRTELSWLWGCRHEIGFWGAVGLNDQSGTSPQVLRSQVRWEANNLYAWFYRHRFCNNATARFWGGFTGENQALLGFDASAPLSRTLALQAAFNYAIPKDNEFPTGTRQESFALGFYLVWTPGLHCPCTSPCNPYRPVLNVADNTSFFINQTVTGNNAIPLPTQTVMP